MTMVASVKVEGFEDLFKRMDELRDEIGKGKTDRIWRKALGVAFQPVLDAAKSAAPKDTGQLADHLYMKVQKPQNRDKSSKYYDGEMYMARVTVNPKRDDTKVRTVLNKRGKFQNISTHRPVALALEFGTASNPAKPFLRPALESNSQKVMEILGNELRLAIDKIAEGKKG